MPFTDTPDPLIASITDAGRNAFARAMAGEIAFRIVGFAVGRGGYDMSNPVKVESIDPSDVTLIDHIFPASNGIKAITGFEKPYPKTLVVNCRLAQSEAWAGLGELGLWAEILHAPATPSEVGDQFLFAIAHSPLVTKTNRQIILNRVVIQF
jgi:hypothetical protein